MNNRRLWARGQGRLPPGTRAVHKPPQLHSHGWDVTGAWLNHSLVLAGAGDWLLLYSIGGDANAGGGARSWGWGGMLSCLDLGNHRERMHQALAL